MATTDLSRAAYDPAKRYVGSRGQMGRVLSDDDLNDNEDIHDGLTQQLVLDVIGPIGTPDGGMAVSAPVVTAAGLIDFTIGAGHLYLGGLPLSVEGDETFLSQSDWLDHGAADQPAA